MSGGEQPFSLGDYDFPSKGLSGLLELLRGAVSLPERLTLRSLDVSLSSDGQLGDFSLSLEGYDGEDSLGVYAFQYRARDALLAYMPPDENRQEALPYNPNNDAAYLDTEIRRLPLVRQMALLDFKRYVLSYTGNRQTQENAVLIDGANGRDYPVLTWAEYQSGQGGGGDGKTAVLFVLHDGTSAFSGKNRVIYRAKPADSASLVLSRNPEKERDFRIRDGQLSLTRDYGETWIPCDLEADALEDTLAYLNASTLPEGNVYISPAPSGVLAVLYGEFPTLCLSQDGGKSWDSLPLTAPERFQGMGYGCRIVDFLNEREGYIGLGTDWSMGRGGYKCWLSTDDGGRTWQEHPLPGRDSEILSGLRFCDRRHGAVSMRTISADDPRFFVTTDGGGEWSEIALPWEEEDFGFTVLARVAALSQEGGQYRLTVSGGANSPTVFEAEALTGPWQKRKDS